MNIRIIKNDYVQPTEVRETVVQDICDIIMDNYLNRATNLTVYAKSAELYICHHKAGNLSISHSMMNSDNNKYIRIHSCEMDAAFKVLQDAGYHIYLERNKKDRISTYRFSKKPVLWGEEAKNLEFDVFID